MSGGYFNYDQGYINNIVDHLENDIKKFESEDIFSKKTIDEFKIGLKFLRISYIYANRIDWLLSGDDGEDSFHRRLIEELESES